ncbi:putative GPI anchored protein [Cryomyces antarcticus]
MARLSILSVLFFAAASLSAPNYGKNNNPPCRFAPLYSQDDVLEHPHDFARDFLYWEGHFHQNNVGYNTANAMTYDGTLLDPTTGLATEKHPFSAASKESIHIMLLAHALDGDADAARFLAPNQSKEAAQRLAFQIMQTKLNTYLTFNATYPGFGGFLPWFLADKTVLTPTLDWVNRVPALDNGELIWAVYAAVEVLGESSQKERKDLAKGWQRWLDYTKRNAARVFYAGAGTVCAVTTIKDQALPVGDAGQSYKCEGSGTLNDPYEGELFMWWLYFFGGLSNADKQALLAVKRPQLVRKEYQMGNIGPITVQEGFWFSAHEQWKLLELPYLSIPLVQRLFLNAERVRTCNSAIQHIPGMFASVNNSTDSSGQIIGYISDAGIPSISNQTTFELDVVTPYSVFPVMLFDRGVAFAWWLDMAKGKKMQNPYGSTESTRVDGTAVSSFVSWDSKITTVVAYLGGVAEFAASKMKRDAIYDEFIDVTQREYEMKFSQPLNGERQPPCLPAATVPDAGLVDYTQCSKGS